MAGNYCLSTQVLACRAYRSSDEIGEKAGGDQEFTADSMKTATFQDNPPEF